jgi:hypothetical protein
LTFKGPGTEPVLEILEGFKALTTINNLSRVITTEQGIRGLSHFLGSDGE